MPHGFDFTPKAKGLISVDVLGFQRKWDPKITICYRAYPDGIKSANLGVGTYVLIDQNPNENEKWNVYVGEATTGQLSERVKNHITKPPPGMESWSVAIIIDGYFELGNKDFNFEEAKNLEHEIWDKTKKLGAVSIKNLKAPSQVKLYKEELERSSLITDLVIELVKVLGCNFESKPKIFNKPNILLPGGSNPKNNKKILSKIRKESNMDTPSLEDLFQNNLLINNEILFATYKGKLAKAKITYKNKKIQIKVESVGTPNLIKSKEQFDSLSGAGNFVKRLIEPNPRTTTNGWEFWSVMRP